MPLSVLFFKCEYLKATSGVKTKFHVIEDSNNSPSLQMTWDLQIFGVAEYF